MLGADSIADKDKQRGGGRSHSHLGKGNGAGLVPGPGWKGRKRVVPGRLGRVPERVVGKVAGQQGPWQHPAHKAAVPLTQVPLVNWWGFSREGNPP